MTTMSIGTALITALFIISVVFMVLIVLWAIIRIVGAVITTIERAKQAPPVDASTGQQG